MLQNILKLLPSITDSFRLLSHLVYVNMNSASLPNYNWHVEAMLGKITHRFVSFIHWNLLWNIAVIGVQMWKGMRAIDVGTAQFPILLLCTGKFKEIVSSRSGAQSLWITAWPNHAVFCITFIVLCVMENWLACKHKHNTSQCCRSVLYWW